jgi:dolichol kinase
MDSSITNSQNIPITYKAEVERKLIHLLSLLIPIIYSFVNDKVIGVSIMIPIMLITLTINYFTNKEGKLRVLLLKMYGDMLREHETKPKWYMLNGASYVLIAATLCLAIFPINIFLVAFSVLVISDTCAALMGRKFGKKKLFGNKTIVGTLSFFFSGSFVALFVVLTRTIEPIGFLFFVIGVLFGTIGELFSNYISIDDNFIVPILTGGVAWLLFTMFSIPIF